MSSFRDLLFDCHSVLPKRILSGEFLPHAQSPQNAGSRGTRSCLVVKIRDEQVQLSTYLTTWDNGNRTSKRYGATEKLTVSVSC